MNNTVSTNRLNVNSALHILKFENKEDKQGTHIKTINISIHLALIDF